MSADVALEATIRDAIMRGFSLAGRGSSTLERFMADVATRDTSYLAALRIASEDPRKKTNAARLISLYLVGFAPSESVLSQVVDFCVRHMDSDPSAFEELHTLASALHQRAQSTRFLDTPFLASNAARAAPIHNDSAFPPPHFTSHSLFRCPHSDPYAGRTVVGIATAKECALVAAEKNRKVREHKSSGKYPITILATKDYVDQTPLELTDEQLGRYMAVLTSFCEHYPHHPEVQLSTGVFVKLLLDAWASKLSFGCDWTFLRQASCAFLTPLLKMVGSEFLCVKKHTFDVILNLAPHAQLFDTKNSFEGATAALEGELVWILQQLIWRLILQNEQSDALWMTVMKCCWAVVPPHQLPQIDLRVLAIFMELTCVSPCAPSVCSRAATALKAALLKDPPGLALPVLNTSRYQLVGGDACIIRLFCDCATTLEARDALFCVLFVAAAETLRRRVQGSQQARGVRPAVVSGRGAIPMPMSPRFDVEIAARALAALRAAKFPWFFWCITQFHTRDILSELKFEELEHDMKPVVFGILGEMLQMVELHQRLPESLTAANTFRRGVQIIPSMLQDDDPIVRGTAVNFAFETLSCSVGYQAAQLEEFCRVISSLPEPRSRRGAISLLSRLSFFTKIYPSHLGIFATLLRSLLAKETYIPNLIFIFHVILHFVTTPHTSALGDGDIVSHCMQGTMHVIQYAGEFVGYAQLWSLYWGLRADSLLQGEAVYTARQVLVSILAPMDIPESPSAMMTAWSRVMGDPYAPVAIIGAKQVIRCSGLAHYDKYEAAINDAQRAEKSELLKSNYMMASSILERVEAECQRFGAAGNANRQHP